MNAADIEILTGIMAVRKDGPPATSARSRAIARNVAMKIVKAGFTQITGEQALAMQRLAHFAALSCKTPEMRNAVNVVEALLSEIEDL